MNYRTETQLSQLKISDKKMNCPNLRALRVTSIEQFIGLQIIVFYLWRIYHKYAFS